MKKNKSKMKLPSRPSKKPVSKQKNKNFIIVLILLLASVICVIAVQDQAEIRQRAANSPDQKVAVDTCIGSGGSCKPAGTCQTNETNMGVLDCGGSLTCCKVNTDGAPTPQPDSDTDGSSCRDKGGYCQQNGFCQGGQGGGEEDCSNDGSQWCCMGPQENVPTLPANPTTPAPTIATPSTIVPSPGCLGSCPLPTTQPDPNDPNQPEPSQPDQINPDQPDNGNGERNEQTLIGVLLGFLLAIIEFFMRLFGGGRN